MRKIRNVLLDVPEKHMKQAAEGGLLVIDTDGAHTSTAHFLCGDNVWGLHQDYLFSESLTHARIGKRIEEAAQKALDAKTDIVLTNEAHDMLLRVLARPNPSEITPMPPALLRLLLPIFDSIEQGEEF